MHQVVRYHEHMTHDDSRMIRVTYNGTVVDEITGFTNEQDVMRQFFEELDRKAPGEMIQALDGDTILDESR